MSSKAIKTKDVHPMKSVIEKLSSYNIFNYLLPGVLFAGLGEQITSFSLVHKDWIIGMFIYYVTGLVISRIGSLILEPLLKKIEFVRFADYKEYVQAVEVDSKIEVLSEQNNMYRTLSSLLIVLVFLKICDELKHLWPLSDDANGFIILAVLLLTFLLSYRKQTQYVVKRVSNAKKKERE